MNPKTSRGLAAAILIAFPVVLAAQAKRPPARKPPSPAPARATLDEATALTNGWALLAQGLLDEASRKATEALSAYPRSAGALALDVEVAVARGGAAAGIAAYERWLGRRTLEEPSIVRRLAIGVLQEAGKQVADLVARDEALRALAAAGDRDAEAELASEAANSHPLALTIRARHGDDKAVAALIAEMEKGTAGSVLAIDALGDSGSRAAIAPIARRLSDQRMEIRAAAAEALGKLGANGAIAQLKPLLQDRSLFVRAKAAGALYRLDDYSVLPVLQQLAGDADPSTKLLAAQAMASHPDPEWKALVRDLTAADNPEIRVAAAELAAPQDPELARRVLAPLAESANPAIRDLASRGFADTVAAGDLASLRPLLKSRDALTRVKAAARIEDLTR